MPNRTNRAAGALLCALVAAGCPGKPPREVARPRVAPEPVALRRTPAEPGRRERRDPTVAVVVAEGAPATVAPPRSPVPDAVRRALPAAIAQAARPAIVGAVYARRGGGPLFLDGLKPSPRAMALAALVKDLPSHGLDPGPYRLPELPAEASEPGAAARLDVALTSALVRYVLDFKILIRAHPFAFMEDPESHIARRQGEVVELAAGALPDVARGLEALWPPDPRYAVLREALARYRALAAGPAPPEVRWRRTIEPGARGKVLGRIQRRLAAEGYYAGEITDTLDGPTIEAVKAFQATHQLGSDGRVGRGTLREMNVSFADRARQLELSLQRWRESRAFRERPRSFAWVNVAAFALEIHEGGRRLRRHRVIVGSNQLDYDRRAWRQGHLNRTKLLKTRIYRIVLNPTWIVPQRIREQEVEPAAAGDRSYYRRKGYSEASLPDGSRVLVQSSGGHNALGRVKFLLEKTNHLYLHDTDKPWLFDHAFRRDYSHGCVRVDEALDLATDLLRRRSGIAPETTRAWIAEGQTRSVDLKEPLPVYIEYNTVGVDDDGRVVFYKDVYDYDAAYHRRELPPRWYSRFGSRMRKPHKVPYIPYETYKRIKARGGLAPMVWPPASGPADPG